MNAHLEFLLSAIYDGQTRLDHPAHLADLRRSGLTDETIRLQKISDVPPHMIDQLLDFQASKVTSAYLIPFPDPRGGWLDHIRMKVFPSIATENGTCKYLQPRRSGVRLFFPLATIDTVLHSTEPLWIIEGEKKSLAVAQLGLPVIGICGIHGWHTGGSSALLADFDTIPLKGRTVELTPDGDVATNPHVARGALGLARALEARGACVRLVVLPVASPEVVS
jgi:hypothetical protein